MAQHEHDDHSELGEMDMRVRALQTVLAQKGYIDPAALDVLIDTYQTRIGPRNGARVVARAWVDAAFREWLLDDASAAIASLGYTGRQGEHMIAVENTETRHNLVVCTLCSCYPWPVLGLPPTWYKSAPYREGPARRAWGLRREPPRINGDTRLGFDCRGALSGGAAASRRDRRLERGRARRARHPRFDDRNRIAARCG